MGGQPQENRLQKKSTQTTSFFFQIGTLENYYHFHHSKTFKRSTLSSRGPHNFLRMDPKVWGWAPWGPHLSLEEAVGLIWVKCELEHLGMTCNP